MIFYLVSVNVVMILINLLNKYRLVTSRSEIYSFSVFRARIRFYVLRFLYFICVILLLVLWV